MLGATPVGTGSHVDAAELGRLLKSAFLHVRQGYPVHAMDFFLAAREMDPSDPRLASLASSVDVVGDNPTPNELEQIWRQCQDMFPELTRDITPLLNNAASGTAARLAQVAERSVAASSRDLRLRVGLTLLLLIMVVGGAAGLVLASRRLHLFEGPVPVLARALEGRRVPILYPQSALQVLPQREAWLTFGTAGILGGALPKVGTQVVAHEVLAVQSLPPKQATQLRRLTLGQEAAQAAHSKATARLEQVLQTRQTVQGACVLAENWLREMRPKSGLRTDQGSKKDMERWRRELARGRKRLAQLARLERQPRQLEAKAKKRLERAQQQLQQLHAHLGGRSLKAPFAGEIMEIKAVRDQALAADTPVLLLRDHAQVRLIFLVAQPGALQVGGEALVVVGNASPLAAKIASLEPQQGQIRIGLELPDPGGALLSAPPNTFHLVREIADPAFSLRPQSLVGLTGARARVLRLREDHVESVEVEVIQQSAGDVLVRDPSGHLRHGMRIVSHRQDNRSLATLVDGTAVVAVEGKH